MMTQRKELFRTGKATFNNHFVLREELRNVLGRPFFSAIVFAMAFVSGFLVCGLSTLDVAKIEGREQQRIDAGLNVLLAVPSGASTMTAQECDRINHRPEVISAGGRVTVESFELGHPGGTSVTAWTVTPGYARAIFPNVSSYASVVIPQKIADQEGLSVGRHFALASGDNGGTEKILQVSDIGKTTGRLQQMSSSVFISDAAAPSVMDCLIEAKPGHGALVSSMVESWFSEDVTVQPIVATHDLGRRPLEELRERASAAAPIFLGSLVVVLGSTYFLIRRTDFSLYRLLGYQATELSISVLASWLFLIVAPICLGSAVGAVAFSEALRSEIVLTQVSVDVIRLLTVSALLPPVAFALVGRGNTLNAIKQGA